MKQTITQAPLRPPTVAPIFLGLWVMLLMTGVSPAQTSTGWRGNTSSDMQTGSNWDNGFGANNNLFFGQAWHNAGRTGSTTINNAAAYSGYRLNFENITGGVNQTFTLTGSAITLFDFGGNAPKIENNSTLVQNINAPIVLNSGAVTFAEINPVSGDLSFGSTVDLAGTTQLRIFGNNGKTVTFGGIISSSGNGGANTVAINQNSTVIYSAANSYTGATFVNAGKLQFNTGGTANSSTINIGDTAAGTTNAEMAVGAVASAGGQSLSSPIIIRSGNSGTATISAQNTSGTNTLSGTITANKAVTITSAAGGTLALTGTSLTAAANLVTFSGAGNITLGTTANGFSSTAGFTHNGSGTLNISNSQVTNLSGTINVGAGGGTLALATNSFASAASALNINGGTITAASATARSVAMPTTITSNFTIGQAVTGTGVVTFSNTMNLGSAVRQITLNNAANTISGLISGAGGGITKLGTGTLTLSNAGNNYTGGNTINAGQISSTVAGALGSTSGALTLGGGTLDLGALSQTVGAVSINAASSTIQNGSLTGSSYAVSHTTGTATVSANLIGSAALTKTGGGTLSLSGANTFSGGATISGGTVAIGVSGVFASSGVTSSALGVGTVSLANGVSLDPGASNRVLGATTFNINGDVNIGNASTTGRLTLDGAINLGSGTRTLTLFRNGTATTQLTSGNEAFKLLQQGTASTPATFGPAITVASGTLRLVSDVSVTGSNYTSAKFDVVTGGSNVTFTGNSGLTIGDRVIAFNQASNPFGTGTGVGPKLTVETGGYYNMSNGGTSSNDMSVFSLSGAGTLTNLDSSGGTAVLTVTGSDTTTFSGALANGGDVNVTLGVTAPSAPAIIALTHAGSGTLILTGNNTTTGATVISGGIVQVGNGGTTGNLGTGAITNTASLVFNRSDAISVGNAIGGTGGTVTQNGSNTLTLSVSNSYTGGTLLNTGTIALGNSGALGSGSITIANGTTLQASGGSRTITNSAVVNGNFTLGGGGSSMTINGGVDLTTGTRTVTLLNSATFGGVVSNGAHTLSSASASRSLTLNGASSNTYAGATTVNGGTLTLAKTGSAIAVAGNLTINSSASAGTALLGGNDQIATTSTITVNTGGTLDLATFNQSLTGVVLTGGSITSTTGVLTGLTNNFDLQSGSVSAGLAGTVGLNKTTGSTVTLTGTNTFSGATTVSAGTLTAGAAGALQSTASITVNGGGTLLLSGNGALDRVNSSAFTLGGGTLSMEGLSNSSEILGALTLSASSILDFGTGSGNTLTFSNLTLSGNTLAIFNWSGTIPVANPDLGGGSQDRLLFTTDVSAQALEAIIFYSDSGTTLLGTGSQIIFGSPTTAFEIVPVPEPTTILGALALLGLVGYRERRRCIRLAKSLGW